MPNKIQPNTGRSRTDEDINADDEIFKIPVVGFLITNYHGVIIQRPMTTYTDSFDDGDSEVEKLEADEVIIGVIPAPPMSCKVLRGNRVLGFEYPGADHDEWDNGERDNGNKYGNKL